METRKAKMKVPQFIDRCGYTKEEREVSNKLFDCYSAFLDLDREHPEEMKEFGYAIHLIQDVIGTRVLRRVYPKGYPTYKIKGGIKMEDVKAGKERQISSSIAMLIGVEKE